MSRSRAAAQAAESPEMNTLRRTAVYLDDFNESVACKLNANICAAFRPSRYVITTVWERRVFSTLRHLCGKKRRDEPADSCSSIELPRIAV